MKSCDPCFGSPQLVLVSSTQQGTSQQPILAELEHVPFLLLFAKHISLSLLAGGQCAIIGTKVNYINIFKTIGHPSKSHAHRLWLSGMIDIQA